MAKRGLKIAGAACVGAVALAVAVAVADPGHGPGPHYGYWGQQMGPYGGMPMSPYGRMGPYGGMPMGPGMIGPGYGMMGPGMMGPGMMGPGMMGPGGMYGGWYGRDESFRGGSVKEADIRRFLERRLELQGLKRLKVGAVKSDNDKITADVTTKDGALVQRYRFDRASGRLLEID